MKDKNILQIFASKEWGGGEQYVYDIIQKLVLQNNNVICISRPSPIISSKLSNLNITHYTLNLNGIYDVKSAYQLKDIIIKHNIDIIHVHNFKTAITAVYAKKLSKSNTKIILTRHLVKKARTNNIYNNIYNNIDKIIFVSNLAKETFLSTNPKIDKSKCEVLFNSVLDNNLDNNNLDNNNLKNNNLEKQTKNNKNNYRKSLDNTINLKEKYNINSNSKLILYTGRLHPEKGIEVLLEAINKIKENNFVLVVAGTGNINYINKLENIVQANNLQDKVIFIGFQENIESIINQCDFGIIPTIVKEAFGLSVIEFMKCGKAVITTNNGAQPEYITNNKTGILVNPNNSCELSNSILLLLKDDKLSEQIGQKSKEFYDKNLNFDIFYSKLTKIYLE